MSEGLSISLLGKFRIASPLGSKNVEARKASDLLAYLLLNRHRTHHREMLASLLWRDQTGSQARRSLRQAIWQLQNCLGALVGKSALPVLVVDSEWLCVDRNAAIEVDIDQLQGVAGSQKSLMGCSVTALSAVVESYAGPLLEGRDERWIHVDREHYQALFFRAANALMERHTDRSEFSIACDIGARVLGFDVAHEPTYRLLMQAYVEAGDRVAALRCYRWCEEALADEFGAEPDQETQELRQRLVEGASSRRVDPSIPLARERADALEDRLARLQRQLDDLRRTLDL